MGKRRELTAFQIKGFAIAAMLLDHIARLFVPSQSAIGFFDASAGPNNSANHVLFSGGRILAYQGSQALCAEACSICGNFLSALHPVFNRSFSDME